jgi:multiple sugar transport system ATP-binding protein
MGGLTLMAGVVLEHLSRVYPGGVKAVSEIDLEVRDREFLVLVGPSGCGKTTTLRMIAGLESVSAGQIRIGGEVVNSVAPRLRNVAMVFQGQGLYPHWTVYKNLAFGLELRGRANWLRRAWRRLAGREQVAGREQAAAIRRRKEIGDQVRQAAACLGIEALLDRLPAELSGGERQRVALGRALVRRPAVFLFDEPLSNLDGPLRAEMRRELKKLGGQLETTIIYVTHDQVEALTLGDRIVVLDRGKIQQVGTPSEVYNRPANRFVAGFIGMPPMNLVEGSWDAKGAADGGACFRGGGWSASMAERGIIEQDVIEQDVIEQSAKNLRRDGATPVVWGLRPEHIRRVRGNENEPVMGAGCVASARVAAVELLGDAMTIELWPAEADGSQQRPLLCKTDADGRLSSGDQVRVWFDMRRAHWFDARTGENLCGPGGVRG